MIRVGIFLMILGLLIAGCVSLAAGRRQDRRRMRQCECRACQPEVFTEQEQDAAIAAFRELPPLPKRIPRVCICTVRELPPHWPLPSPGDVRVLLQPDPYCPVHGYLSSEKRGAER